MILIDNHDSFTYNIVQYFQELGACVRVFKNDEITVEDLKRLDFESIVISPGPGNPDESGVSMDVIREFYRTKKILGICLGHQCIAQCFGGKVVKAQEPVHGKVSKIYFNEKEPLFESLNQGFEATRYHSLVVEKESLASNIIPTAQTDDGVLMGLRLRDYKVYGVQFHPEAILTQGGKVLLRNFLNI